MPSEQTFGDELVSSQYREMVNATPRSLAYLSAADDWRIQSVNRAGAAALAAQSAAMSLSAEQAVGARAHDLFDLPELRPETLRAQTAPAFATVHRAGEIFEVYVAPALDPQGQHVGALVVWSTATTKHATLQNVAESFDGLSTAVEEISRHAAEAITTIQQAETICTTIGDRFAELRQASEAVGDVVGVINRVASQTQLLALNATIEAARVGDAGKGFAVVASEVKSLAQETSSSTGSIHEQIAAIQAGTLAVAEAVAGITGIMTTIEDRQASIAAAVEEQATLTIGLRHTLAEAINS